MFDPTLIEFSDYILVATDPHIVIAGDKGQWAPRVRGYDPDDGSEISLAWYFRDDYETKAAAMAIARQVMACVKSYRQHHVDNGFMAALPA